MPISIHMFPIPHHNKVIRGLGLNAAWWTSDTGTHHGMKTSWRRQCDILRQYFGGKCLVLPSKRMLSKHHCSPCSTFHGNNISWWPLSLSAGYCSLTQSWNGSEMFEALNNEFEVLTWPPNYPDLYPINHLWSPLLIIYRTQRICC